MCEIEKWLVDYVLTEQAINELNQQRINIEIRLTPLKAKAVRMQQDFALGKAVDSGLLQQTEQVLASMIDCQHDIGHRLKALNQQQEQIVQQLQVFDSSALAYQQGMRMLSLKVQSALAQSAVILG